MVKQPLDNMNISDYSFQNVINVIESADLDTLTSNKLDSVLFENGIISESERLEETVKKYITLNNLNNDGFINYSNNLKNLRRYFNAEQLSDILTQISTIDQYKNDVVLLLNGNGVDGGTNNSFLSTYSGYIKTIYINSPAASDYFGNSCAIGNDFFLIGSHYDDDKTSAAGKVEMFDINLNIIDSAKHHTVIPYGNARISTSEKKIRYRKFVF